MQELYRQHIEALTHRYDQLLFQHGYEQLLVFSGAPPVRFLDDQPYPYRVNPHFKALAPLAHAPYSWVVYRPGEKPKLLVYQPFDYWHSVRELPRGFWTSHFATIVLRQPEEAKDFLGRAKSAFIGEICPHMESWSLGDRNPQALIDAIHWERAYKSKFELACMEKANQLAVRGHVAARNAFFDDSSELEIGAAYLLGCRATQNDMPYEPIVAINENAAVLHYTDLKALRHSEPSSLLIDAGADYLGYASDITRTYARHSGIFRDFVAEVDQAQQRLVQLVQVGRSYIDVHLCAHVNLAQVLCDFGIVKVNAESAVEQRLTSLFFPHGVGHLLGLQVHDVGGQQESRDGGHKLPPAEHAYLRCTRVIEEGMVFTIEPGLYFIDLLLEPVRQETRGRSIDWEVVDRFRRFGGVRIEDDVVATSQGPVNLTRSAFAAEDAKVS